jgi:oligopeptide/dipeptide ABC transporter ATP-binding protein
MTVRTVARLLPDGADVRGGVRFDGAEVFGLRTDAWRSMTWPAYSTIVSSHTAALVQARPEIDRRVGRLPAITGHPTTAYEAPDGCAFAPRCGFAQEECRAGVPPLLRIGPSQTRCVRMPGLRGHMVPQEHVGSASNEEVQR